MSAPHLVECMHTIANSVDGIFRLFSHYFDRRFELRSRLNSGLYHHHLPVDPFHRPNTSIPRTTSPITVSSPKSPTVHVIGHQDRANGRARQTRAQPQQPTVQQPRNPSYAPDITVGSPQPRCGIHDTSFYFRLTLEALAYETPSMHAIKSVQFTPLAGR